MVIRKKKEEFHNLGNGAKLAVLMLIFHHGLELAEKANIKSVAPTLENAKHEMQNMPKLIETGILSKLESADDDEGKVKWWLETLLNTVDICKKNGKLQQTYIDTWRDMRSAGLLQ